MVPLVSGAVAPRARQVIVVSIEQRQIGALEWIESLPTEHDHKTNDRDCEEHVEHSRPLLATKAIAGLVQIGGFRALNAFGLLFREDLSGSNPHESAQKTTSSQATERANSSTR